MKAVFGLFVILLGVSHGGETCDGRQNGAKCFGALGGSVGLQLMDDASKIFKFQLKNNTTRLLYWINNKLVINLFKNRSSFTPINGTIWINDLSRKDGDEYTLEVFDNNGKNLESRTLQLMIQGGETCDGRQNGTTCFGALGGSVGLQLMDDASKIFKFQLNSNTTRLLYWINNKFVTNLFKNRSSFTPMNGTIWINDLSRKDGDKYTLEAYNENGKTLESRTLQLMIQAPVSSVQLVSECLSQGEMNASCSSEGGDSPQYSWTLDGRTLTHTQLLSGNNESQNITLKQGVSGQLVCSVSNHVSLVRKEKTTCGFKLIQCILQNGTYISQWLPPTNETLCRPSTTPEGKEIDITVSNKPSINITSSDHTGFSSEDSWYMTLFLPYCSLRAVLVFLILTGIFVYFACKKNDMKKAEDSEDHEAIEYENDSVENIEMRRSASLL